MSGKVSEKTNTRPTGVENVNVTIPDETSTQDKKQTFGRPCLVKVLIVMVIVLLLIVAASIAVLVVVHNGDDDDDNDVDNVDDVKNVTKEEVCTSRDCIVIAGIMSQRMDPTVNPCQNFAEYACGGFYRETSLPRDKERFGLFVEASDDTYALLRDVVEEWVSADDAEYLVKIKDAYWSCIHEESVGLHHFMNTTFARMWPTLNPSWDPAAFDMNKVMIEYASHYITPFMSIDVHPDFLNSSARAIYFELPSDFIVSMNDLLGPRNGSGLAVLQTYVTDITVELGSDPEVARKDAEDVVDLLIRVATTSAESTQGYHISSLRNLEHWYPDFAFTSVLQAMFNKTGIHLTNDHKILLRNYAFFNALRNLLNDTNPRVIQNFFAVHHAHVYLDRLTDRLSDITFELDKAQLGIRVPVPTWKQCLGEIAYVMPLGVGKEFIKRNLSQESVARPYINQLVDSVKNKFTEILDEADWLMNATKTEAKRKLDKMGRRLGYPEENFSEEDINDVYRDISVVRDNFFENRQTLVQFFYASNLKKLEEKVDKTKWEYSIIDANAFYIPLANQIVIPAGVMKPTIFSAHYPRSLNYGSIGSIIGHEITHGFDNAGSSFDADGDLRDWWEPADRTEFNDRLQCVIDQYDNFTHQQINLKLNGDINVGEAVADTIGIKLAFRAFREEYESSPSKELPLPGLGLTPYQQLYLTYAQRYCQIRTDEWLAFHIENAPHPPGRFRIIGTFQNDENFAEVFNCSPGSYMNPTEKCVVW